MIIFKIINILDKKQKLVFYLFFFLSLVSMLLETASIGLLIPFISTIISDSQPKNFYNFFQLLQFDQKSKEEILLSIAIMILIIQTFKSIFLTFYSYLEQKFLTTTRAEISNKLFNIYLNQPLSYYLDNNSSQFIRNLQDADIIRMLLRNIILLIREVILFLGLSLFVVIFEPKGSILVVVGLVAIGYIFTKYINIKAKIWGKIRQKNVGLSIKINSEAFKIIKEIKIYRKLNFFLFKFFKSNSNIRYSELRQNFFNSLPRLWLEWLLILTFSVLIFYLIYIEISAEKILLSLIVFAAVGIKLIPSLSRLINSVQILSYYKSVVETIYNLIRKKSYKKKKYLKKINSNLTIKNIVLKNIKFFYKDKKKIILNNLNFKFRKNHIYGIIGESGSGKTTLINILLGLLSPTKGGVFINEKINISDHIDSWHKNIGYVQQNYSLIDDTIKNNITFGLRNNQINKKNFDYAIKNSKIINFIKSKEDIFTKKIGENGDNISGGQKQRVALARALYNRPSILILDEFTSSLDHKLEKEIVNEIKTLKKDRIIFIVSHKLSTLKVCDVILKIDNKRLKLSKYTTYI